MNEIANHANLEKKPHLSAWSWNCKLKRRGRWSSAYNLVSQPGSFKKNDLKICNLTLVYILVCVLY